MIRKGTWWLSSKLDPRWNISGTGYVGGFLISSEAEQAIEKLKQQYGKPPKDLEYGCMKD